LLIFGRSLIWPFFTWSQMAGHISFFSGSHPAFELRHLLQWELGQISCPVEILGSF
jgi:hypothetical protein